MKTAEVWGAVLAFVQTVEGLLLGTLCVLSLVACLGAIGLWRAQERRRRRAQAQPWARRQTAEWEQRWRSS